MAASCQLPWPWIERFNKFVEQIRFASHFVLAATKKRTRSGCIKGASSLRLHRRAISLWLDQANPFVVAASRKQARFVCIEERIFVVTSGQQSRCGCIEAASSLCLHQSYSVIVAASSKPFRCGSIKASISLWLHRANPLVFASLGQHSCCLWIEATTSLWMHRGNDLVFGNNNFVMTALRQPLCCGCIEAKNSL